MCIACRMMNGLAPVPVGAPKRADIIRGDGDCDNACMFQS